MKSLPDAINLIGECRDVLAENQNAIRSDCGTTKELNGPEGSVSAKTTKSVEMLQWGLSRLQDNLAEYSFGDTNLLSCMTLDIEHLHSTSHVKKILMSKQEYCRSFGTAMKESLKRITYSSFYYHTSHKKAWYPKPEHSSIDYASLPPISPLPAVKMGASDIEKMLGYASAFGAAVRQRTNRQETTMAKHGTLPEYIYQRSLAISASKISLQTESTSNPTNDESNEEDCFMEEEVLSEYDSSSSIESDLEVEQTNEMENDFACGIDRNSMFLIGATSRFGRAVRLNSRFLH